MNKPETSDAYREALRMAMLGSRSEKTRMRLERLLMSQDEAACLLGISRRTLLAEIGRGRLRYVLVGKRRKFRPDDLTAYIELQGRGREGSGASTGRLPETVLAFRRRGRR